MGMFGTYATPQGMPAGPYDPTMQVKQAGPRRLGMLGQIAQALTGPTGGRNLQIAGATLRQLGGGANSNTLSELLAQLQQQDQQRLQNTWQQTLQQRQQGEWNTEDKQSGRLADWVNTLPPDQRSEAMVDPARAYQSHVQAETTANMPLTPYQTQSLSEEHRHNVATENRAASGGANGWIDEVYTPETIEPLAQAVAMGAPVSGISGGRNARVSGMINQRAAAIRQERGLSPDTYGLVQAAYAGNRRALTDLQTRRAGIAQAEQTALTNLHMVASLSQRVRRTDIPIANDALLQYRANVQGDPDTAAYVQALLVAREEYAKVISGNTSAQGITDAARHSAENLIRPGMTQAQIDRVISTAEQEMQNRMDGFDATIQGVSGALVGGQTTPGTTPETPSSGVLSGLGTAATAGAVAAPAAGSTDFVRDPRTGQIVPRR